MTYRLDPDERADTIAATIENYKIGAYGPVRAKSLLVACGLNATEIEEFLGPHHSENSRNFATFKGHR